MLSRIIGIVFLWVALCLSGCQSDDKLFQSNKQVDIGEALIDGAFSANGQKLLLLTSNNQVKLWNVKSATYQMELPQEHLPSPVRSLTLSYDASIALVMGDNDVAIYRLEPFEYIGKMRFEGQSPLARISSYALSNDKLRFVTGMEDGTINMAQLDTGINNSFRPHRQRVTHLLFEPNNDFLYSGSLDGQIAKWRFAEPKALYSTIFQHRITSLAFDQKRDRLFVSDGLREQIVYDSQTFVPHVKLDYLSRFKPFRNAVFDSTGQLLITAGTKRQLTFWNMKNGEDLGMWEFSTKKDSAFLIAMAEIADGQLHTLNSEGILEIWPLEKLTKQIVGNHN